MDNDSVSYHLAFLHHHNGFEFKAQKYGIEAVNSKCHQLPGKMRKTVSLSKYFQTSKLSNNNYYI